MSKRILISTNADRKASAFRRYLLENSPDLEVIRRSIPYFHNILKAIQIEKPDIYYLSMPDTYFDSTSQKGIENEVINKLYKIKIDPHFQNLRIAVEVPYGTNLAFLSRLALLQVWDIFKDSRDSDGSQKVNLSKINSQLSRPANLSNVRQYISSVNPQDLKARIIAKDPDKSFDLKKSRELEKQNRMLLKRVNELQSKSAIDTVPRSEFKALLDKVSDYINNSSDEKAKALFKKIIDSNSAQGQKIAELEGLVHGQTDTIVNLNSELEQKKKQSAVLNEKRAGPRSSSVLPDQEQGVPKINRPQKIRRKPIASDKKGLIKSNNVHSLNKGEPKKRHLNFGKHTLRKVILIALSCVLIMSLVSAFVIHSQSTPASPSQTANSSSTSTESLEMLLHDGKYVKAAKEYPAKGLTIENQLLLDNTVKDKGSIVNKISEYYDADPVKFDKAYFARDFSEAASIYNASDDENLTSPNDARRLMISYTLMKVNKLDQAVHEAKPLHNDDLNQRIKIYKKFYSANQTLKAKLKHGGLSKSERSDAVDQINKNEDQMNKL